jgi:dTDP-glucose pyrophosphorylase
MLGIIPAAGRGLRIQPLGCSKELLPVGSRRDGGVQRPKAVSEFLLERLIAGGATRLCIVLSPGKFDIIQYYGEQFSGTPIIYVVQTRPAGLCDALFRAALVTRGDDVLFGLPDTVWFPDNALAFLPPEKTSLLLFPVRQPQYFDAVLTDAAGDVREVQVKVPSPGSSWIWGAGRITAKDFDALHRLWLNRSPRDEYLGTLLNAHIAQGGRIGAIAAGQQYLDVGTFEGYAAAMQLIEHQDAAPQLPRRSRTAG